MLITKLIFTLYESKQYEKKYRKYTRGSEELAIFGPNQQMSSATIQRQIPPLIQYGLWHYDFYYYKFVRNKVMDAHTSKDIKYFIVYYRVRCYENTPYRTTSLKLSNGKVSYCKYQSCSRSYQKMLNEDTVFRYTTSF